MSSRNEDKHHEHRARRGLRVGALREQGRELQVEHDRISNQDLRTSLVAMLNEKNRDSEGLHHKRKHITNNIAFSGDPKGEPTGNGDGNSVWNMINF